MGGPRLRRPADCSHSSEFDKKNALVFYPPTPLHVPHPPCPPIQSVSPSVCLPRPLLLSAAPRHQVDGLLQFVPQFVFATVTVPVQRRQDLQGRRREVRSEPGGREGGGAEFQPMIFTLFLVLFQSILD